MAVTSPEFKDEFSSDEMLTGFMEAFGELSEGQDEAVIALMGVMFGCW